MGEFSGPSFIKGINQAIKAIERFEAQKDVIERGDEQDKAHEYDRLINVLKDFQKNIPTPESLKGKAKITKDLSNKIHTAINSIEKLSIREEKEQKVVEFQGTLFWNQLHGIKTLLETVRVEGLERGKKVEKTEPGAGDTKGGG